MDSATKFFESIRSCEVAAIRDQINNKIIDLEGGRKKLLEVKKKIESTETFKKGKDAEFMKTAIDILHQIDEILK